AKEQSPPRISANRLVKGLLDLKDEGNTELTRGESEQAAATYGRALARLEEVRHELERPESGSLKATLLANRAQAFIDLEKWEEALHDAQSSLEVQPDNPKALHRKGVAAKGLASAKVRRDQGESLKQALFCKNAGNKLLSQ
ncbi:unnamed protein product, partial [Polarella glacialis]